MGGGGVVDAQICILFILLYTLQQISIFYFDFYEKVLSLII